jgi:outer membrane protein TolC
MAVHFPKLDAFARWGRNTFRRSDLLDSDATQTELGLELKVPLFSGLTSVFDRRILSHNEAILRIEERRLRDSFELERVRAEKNFRFALTQAQTYQLALRQAEESVRVANRTYRLGTSTYLQVSEAQKNLAEAEINFETAQFEVLQKVSDLYVAFGWPLEEWVDQLDRHYLSLQKP